MGRGSGALKGVEESSRCLCYASSKNTKPASPHLVQRVIPRSVVCFVEKIQNQPVHILFQSHSTVGVAVVGYADRVPQVCNYGLVSTTIFTIISTCLKGLAHRDVLVGLRGRTPSKSYFG